IFRPSAFFFFSVRAFSSHIRALSSACAFLSLASPDTKTPPRGFSVSRGHFDALSERAGWLLNLVQILLSGAQRLLDLGVGQGEFQHAILKFCVDVLFLHILAHKEAAGAGAG